MPLLYCSYSCGSSSFMKGHRMSGVIRRSRVIFVALVGLVTTLSPSLGAEEPKVALPGEMQFLAEILRAANQLHEARRRYEAARENASILEQQLLDGIVTPAVAFDAQRLLYDAEALYRDALRKMGARAQRRTPQWNDILSARAG